jgi:hypothetical protein
MGYGVYVKEQPIGRVSLTPENLQEITEFVWQLSTADSQDEPTSSFIISIRYFDQQELFGENPNMIYELTPDQFGEIDNFDIEYLNFKKSERIHININAGDLSTDAGILQENIIIVQADNIDWVSDKYDQLKHKAESWEPSHKTLSIFDQIMWIPIILIAPVYIILVANDIKLLNLAGQIPYEYLITGLFVSFLAVSLRVRNSETLRSIYGGVWINAGSYSSNMFKQQGIYKAVIFDLVIFVLMFALEILPFWFLLG